MMTGGGQQRVNARLMYSEDGSAMRENTVYVKILVKIRGNVWRGENPRSSDNKSEVVNLISPTL